MNSTFKQKLIDCFRKHFEDDLVAVILFGSQARGEARPESDYDIFLFAKKLPKRRIERLIFVRRAIAVKFR